MEFVGTIKEIGASRQIKENFFRDIVVSQINYNNGFETNVAFTFINEKCTFNGNKDYPLKQLYDDKVLADGMMLKFLFSISARKTQDGKWFNSITCWGINTMDYGRAAKTQSAAAPQQFQQQQVQQAPQPQSFQNYSNQEAPF
jgi:hypothetical protein